MLDVGGTAKRPSKLQYLAIILAVMTFLVELGQLMEVLMR